MSEHENPLRQHQSEPQRQTPEPPKTEGLSPAEKSLMRRLTEVLRFADFMALLGWRRRHSARTRPGARPR